MGAIIYIKSTRARGEEISFYENHLLQAICPVEMESLF